MEDNAARRCLDMARYLAATGDTVRGTARRFGISENRAVRYECDSAGTALNFKVVSETIGNFRAGAPIADNWSEKIRADYAKRGENKTANPKL